MVSLSQYYNMKSNSHPFSCKAAAYAKHQARGLDPAGKGALIRKFGR